MPHIDYARLTHYLEGAIDTAIEQLSGVSHPVARQVQYQLKTTLRQVEEEIIGDRKKVLTFPQLSTVQARKEKVE